MPKYTAQRTVMGHRIAAVILNAGFFFEKKFADRMIVERSILNPKPPRQAVYKKESSLLPSTSGLLMPRKP